MLEAKPIEARCADPTIPIEDQPHTRSNITRIEPQGWLSIIDKMVDKGVSMEQLDKMLDMQQKWEREQARKAYVAALSEFKANAPTLTKNKRVAFDSGKGKVQYDHITLAEACRVIIPELGKYGLSHSWETVQQDGGLIQVTCRLSHEAGHSESVSLKSVPDTSGAKNSIQSIGSTVSYLERYTFLAILGMSAEEMDNDGKASAGAGQVIDDKQQDKLSALLAEADIQGARYAKFLYWLGVENLLELPASKFSEACRKLEAQIAKNKKEAGI